MSKAEPAVRYVVERLRWWQDLRNVYRRSHGSVRVSSFATFEEADVERARLEATIRERLNPFQCGTAVHYWTHLDEPQLRDWLMDHGISLPELQPDGTANWAKWWSESQEPLGADGQAIVWEVLDKVRFYTVTEHPVRPVGYMLLKIDWESDDNFLHATSDTADVVTVFRSRERAEAECAARNAVAQNPYGSEDEEESSDFNPDHGAPFDLRYRLRHQRGLLDVTELKRGEGLFYTDAKAPFFEVVEVELEGLG